MRVFPRIALTLLAAFVLVQPVIGQPQQQANCPLTLTATNPPASQIALSPHGAFRSGNLVYVLRGQTLTTYTITDLGDLQIAREDFVAGLANRNSIGGTAFSNGFLYVSSEAGLEVYDLRNVRSGGNAPIFVTRVSGFNYRRLTVSGNTLAALFPATDVPCAPSNINCLTFVDLFNVSNPAAPVRGGQFSSSGSAVGSFNDIAFNFGNLIVTGNLGTTALNVANLGAPSGLGSIATPGTFLVSNGLNLLGVGNDNSIVTYALTAPFTGFNAVSFHSTATLQVGRANRIMFHPQAFIDDANNRLITIIDEIDQTRLTAARSIAFDVFDYSVPMFEGRDPRVYESVSYLQGDEVKFHPIAVGPVVYVVGETTGMQTYGACGQMAGRIETDNVAALPCGGSEIHGWVTGAQRINSVELFLDNTTSRTSTSLGLATVGGPPRLDVPAVNPVVTWRISTLLDTQVRGNYVLRAVGTDALNNRRQFAAQPIFFPGPGQNCFNRRRTTGR
jgi:hypothetical protein